MLAEPVAGALDLGDDSMVEHAIEQRPGDDGEIFLVFWSGRMIPAANYRSLTIAMDYGWTMGNPLSRSKH